MKRDALQLCRSYVSAHTSHPAANGNPGETRLATITLSRQAGARGRSLAQMMAERLNEELGADEVPWTVFDRNLMDRVLADHDLPREIGRFFPEARWSEVDTMINTLLHRHPEAWTIFEHTVDTIRKLAHLGHAIIVGRAANFITRRFPHALHLRLTGSLGERIRHLCRARGLTKAEARSFVQQEDKNRRAYVRQHFDQDIEDPSAYTLLVNTDLLENYQIVEMLKPLVRERESHPLVRSLAASPE